MTPFQAIIDRLEAKTGTVEGTTLFAGSDANLPTVTTGFLTVNETGGVGSDGTHNEGNSIIRRPNYQVVARAGLYLVASDLVHRALDAFLEKDGSGKPIPLANIWIGDVFFLTLRPLSEPFPLPLDPRGRVRLAFNLGTEYRR